MPRPLLILILAVLTHPTWAIRPEIEMAQLQFLAGETQAAKQTIQPVYSDLLKTGQIASPDGIDTTCLLLQIEASDNPQRSLHKIRQLLDRSITELGETTPQTLRVRIALADVLAANEQYEEAIAAWKTAGKLAEENHPGTREHAECHRGLAQVLTEPPTLAATFNGDPKHEILPQIQFEIEYSDNAIQAGKLYQESIRLNQEIGGENDPVATFISQNVRQIHWECGIEIEKMKADATRQIIAQLYDQEHEKARNVLKEWKAQNPPPTVHICQGKFAECYHRSDCWILEDCSDITIPIDEAIIRYGRRFCNICDPPGIPTPPVEVTHYRFNGKSIPINSKARR